MALNRVLTPEEKAANKKVLRIFLTIVAVILAIIIISSCTVVIEAGHTGVVSTFGKISEDVLQEGFHLKAPWQQVTKMDNRIVKLEVETEAFSSDLQTVAVRIAVNYRVDTSKSYYIVKNIGRGYEGVLVTPTVNEILKSVIAHDTAEKSITNRAAISTSILDGLNEKLNPNGIYVADINIIDFDFSDTYIQAIEAKQVAEQQKLKAQIEQEQLTMEKQAQAERDIIAANAALEVSKIEAEAVEYAGQKEAAANRAISESITPELIEYNKIQRWNGELPRITGADTIITMDDLKSDSDGQ